MNKLLGNLFFSLTKNVPFYTQGKTRQYVRYCFNRLLFINQSNPALERQRIWSDRHDRNLRHSYYLYTSRTRERRIVPMFNKKTMSLAII